jgi:tetratricopeptide (TPR) repeat protein
MAEALVRTIALAREAQPDELSSTDARRMVRQALIAGAARQRARNERRSWWLAGGGLLFSLASACVLLWIGQPRSARPRAVVVSRAAQTGAEVEARPMRLQLPGGDTLVAAAGAQFELQRMDATERAIRLSNGSALFEVEPLQAGQAFVVVTPHARVRVHGTVFSVAVNHGRTSVRVYEGVVSVVDDARPELSLGVGQSYASDGQVLDPEATPLLADAREVVARRAEQRAAQLASGPAPDSPPQAATPATPGAPLPAAAPLQAQTPPASLCEARAWLHAGELQRALDAARDAPQVSVEHAGWCLVEADALRSMGRHAEAAQAYMAAVASSTGGARAQAGYKAAAEYLRELADARSALAALSLAGVDAQGSALRERGMSLRIEAMRALGEPIDDVAKRYLLEFPDSAGAPGLATPASAPAPTPQPAAEAPSKAP